MAKAKVVNGMLTFEHKGITYNIPKYMMGSTRGDITAHIQHKVSMFKFYIDNGEMPTRKEMKEQSYKDAYGVNYSDNPADQINTKARKRGVQEWLDYISTRDGQNQLKKDNPDIYFDDKGMPVFDQDTGDPLTVEQVETNRNFSGELNPYIAWQEQQRARQESQELALLNQQTRAGMQNAEISAQQSMIQQAQFKNDLVEQIKLDRMAKMRQGISPMQIAQENLQFMVGNMQQANQQMSGVTQSRLATTQQSEMNPYQAYLNSVNSQAYQANAQIATGMAATDASDLYMQAMKYARSQGRNYLLPTDYEVVSRTEVNKN